MRYCSLILMEHAVLPHVSALTQPPAKFLVIDYENKTPLETFRQWVLEEYPQQLDAFFSCQAYLEIIPRGLSKGNTLVQLAQRLGIPIENTGAAGDAGALLPSRPDCPPQNLFPYSHPVSAPPCYGGRGALPRVTCACSDIFPKNSCSTFRP